MTQEKSKLQIQTEKEQAMPNAENNERFSTGIKRTAMTTRQGGRKVETKQQKLEKKTDSEDK